MIDSNKVWKKIFEPAHIPFHTAEGRIEDMFIDTIDGEETTVWVAKSKKGEGYFFNPPKRIQKILEEKYGDINALVPFCKIAEDEVWDCLSQWGFFIEHGQIVVEPQGITDNSLERFKTVKRILENL